MRSFEVVVVDEFPVEREPVMFQVVGSEPSFNLSLRCWFPDASKNMLDPMLKTVLVEA